MALFRKLSELLYRLIRWLVWLFYPKMQSVGLENLTEEPVVIVGNHSQLHGPISAELYGPGNCKTWCAGQMMHLKDVPGYAFQDFWSQKPRYTHWFYKALSYVIAPLSVVIFNNAETIGVYHDSRILSTFKKTVAALQNGNNIIIFPEHDQPHNHIVYDFQEKFVDVARMYYKRTGKELTFVPVYIPPKRKMMCYGKPVRFSAETPIDEERTRICRNLMAEITRMAEELPEHTVIPYRNIPKKYYPTNHTKEVPYGKTGG